LRIAIIAPDSLPIPSKLGGAIETLTTSLLEYNERSSDPCEFTVFNKFRKHVVLDNSYASTNLVFIKENVVVSFVYKYFWAILRRVLRRDLYPRSNFISKCVEEIEKHNYDYILVEGGCYQILQIKSAMSTKIILHLHTDILNIKTPLCRETTRACYKILCVSDYLKERLIEIDNSNRDKTFILKNCIDLKLFRKNEMFRSEIRSQLNICASDMLIMYCGRLSEEKGVKELLLAFEAMGVRNTKLVIVGSSWFSSNIKTEYVRSLELIAERIGESVVFTGYIEQKILPRYYSAADIFVCPSTGNEAAGLVVVEALACGVPAIVTRKGGLVEYASLDSCEFINCDNNFVGNIREALIRMVKERGYYQEKRKMTRKSVGMFNLDDYYYNFRNLIKEKV